MLLNSIETLHYSDPPQVHKAHSSTTETLHKALSVYTAYYKHCSNSTALALHAHKRKEIKGGSEARRDYFLTALTIKTLFVRNG
ncbi:hypothetical protein INR49_022371 [Caranx melampygus]|nr:hypothetical protein INR49_022371 [Caranx melampygus]